MLKNKKAVEISNLLVVLVIMVAVILVAIFIPTMIGRTTTDVAARAACEKSLQMTQNAKILNGDLVDKSGDSSTINCPTEYIDTPSTGKVLVQEFADNIYGCWNLYKNKDDLFDQSTGTYCVICKSITSNKEDGGFKEGLIDYLKRENAPIVQAKEKKTYMDAMGGDINLAPGAEGKYNLYKFYQGDEIAIIVTFGDKDFKGQHMLFDYNKGVGLLLHPYQSVSLADLGCYSFEGRSNSLTYRR